MTGGGIETGLKLTPQIVPATIAAEAPHGVVSFGHGLANGYVSSRQYALERMGCSLIRR